MYDFFFDWIVVFLPWRVLLALLAAFVLCAGLLVLWATHG